MKHGCTMSYLEDTTTALLETLFIQTSLQTFIESEPDPHC